MRHKQKSRFPDLGEFRFVEQLLHASATTAPLRPSADWVGPGDDCALLDGWLISTDLSVEGTHFRLDWSSIEEAMEKCLLSNFSDINAMGGTAKLVSLGICLRKDWGAEEQARLVAIVSLILARYNVQILGGDTVVGEQAMFAITVFGQCENSAKPLLRSGAKLGDYVYVSGKLGAPEAGLYALLHKRSGVYWDLLIASHLVPQVPLGLGAKLLTQGSINACIDISDGLSSELHHLAIQSQVKIQIEESLIPIHPLVSACAGFTERSGLSFALHGGEEYQLLFMSPLPPSLLVLDLWPFDVTCIGRVHQGSGVSLLRSDGTCEILPAGAWSHL